MVLVLVVDEGQDEKGEGEEEERGVFLSYRGAGRKGESGMLAVGLWAGHGTVGGSRSSAGSHIER